jgi:hypothetical protein
MNREVKMHVAWAQAIAVNSVIIAMTFFVRARSLLPPATGWRTVPLREARR